MRFVFCSTIVATISATDLRFDDDVLWVDLTDSWTPGVSLAWFPKLLDVSPADRSRFEISAEGLHWDTLDEDISIAGLLAGSGARRITSVVA